MEYKLINKALNEIFNGYTENLKFSTFMVEEQTRNVINEDYGMQGDYNEYYRVFKFKEVDLCVKLTYRTDSYGYNDFLSSINFVQPVVKEVITYDEI